MSAKSATPIYAQKQRSENETNGNESKPQPRVVSVSTNVPSTKVTDVFPQKKTAVTNGDRPSSAKLAVQRKQKERDSSYDENNGAEDDDDEDDGNSSDSYSATSKASKATVNALGRPMRRAANKANEHMQKELRRGGGDDEDASGVSDFSGGEVTESDDDVSSAGGGQR